MRAGKLKFFPKSGGILKSILYVVSGDNLYTVEDKVVKNQTGYISNLASTYSSFDILNDDFLYLAYSDTVKCINISTDQVESTFNNYDLGGDKNDIKVLSNGDVLLIGLGIIRIDSSGNTIWIQTSSDTYNELQITESYVLVSDQYKFKLYDINDGTLLWTEFKTYSGAEPYFILSNSVWCVVRRDNIEYRDFNNNLLSTQYIGFNNYDNHVNSITTVGTYLTNDVYTSTSTGYVRKLAGSGISNDNWVVYTGGYFKQGYFDNDSYAVLDSSVTTLYWYAASDGTEVSSYYAPFGTNKINQSFV